MIAVSGARKTFLAGTPDERVAIDGIDLRLDAGTFAVMIGSNGAGKSTLLDLIAGTLPLDGGQIQIDGHDVTRQKVERRAALISRVFQDPRAGTATGMTVEENLLLAELRGQQPGLGWALTTARRARWRDALARLGLGLEERLAARVDHLSGGQRQSLSLVMAMLNAPKVLLLDEHTAALDPRTAARVLEATARIIAETQVTAVMVTHNMRHAIDYGTRLLMMDAGRIRLDIPDQDKRRMTVEDLVAQFQDADDKILLAR